MNAFLGNHIRIEVDDDHLGFKKAKHYAKQKALEFASDLMLLSWYQEKTVTFGRTWNAEHGINLFGSYLPNPGIMNRMLCDLTFIMARSRQSDQTFNEPAFFGITKRFHHNNPEIANQKCKISSTAKTFDMTSLLTCPFNFRR